jgi:hypothetical protein
MNEALKSAESTFWGLQSLSEVSPGPVLHRTCFQRVCAVFPYKGEFTKFIRTFAVLYEKFYSENMGSCHVSDDCGSAVIRH